MKSISPEAKIAIEIVLKAGKNLKPHFGKTEVDFKKSSFAGDGVTKLDIETEAYFFENLRKKCPSIGFKGEESGIIDISSGKFWLADPIDGTLYFSRGVIGCTTMLALIEDGAPKVGIIYDFVGDKLFFAEKGKGSYLNGKPIRVSDRGPEDSLISVECKLSDKVLSKFVDLHQNYEISEAGYPAGNQYAMVACGQLEARICLNPFGKDHDFAPGSLLIQEAGGIVANFGKKTYNYTDLNFIAANKKVFCSLTSGKNPIFPIEKETRSKTLSLPKS